MTDLIVACASDVAHGPGCGYFDVLKAQVERAGLPFVYEPLPDFSWAGLVRWERDFCLRHPHERVVFVDTADFLFVGTAAELRAIVPENHVLYHGEGRCWPEAWKADLYPQPRPGPYPFVNGTGPAGSTDAIVEAIDWIHANAPIRGEEKSIFADNDQRAFCDAYLAGHGHVDHDGRLSAQLNAIDPRDVRIEGGRLVLPSGIRPQFIHANGAAKSVYGAFLAELAR